jgi:hypothetical protein
MPTQKNTMKKGDKVHWKWGAGEAEGTITEKSEKTITRKIKGTEVKRKASKDEPAYVVEQKDGDKVVKSGSELKKGAKKK